MTEVVTTEMGYTQEQKMAALLPCICKRELSLSPLICMSQTS